MIQLRYNGWGPDVMCEHCHHALLLESKTNYEYCATCGEKANLDANDDSSSVWYVIAIGICIIGLGIIIGLLI